MSMLPEVPPNDFYVVHFEVEQTGRNKTVSWTKQQRTFKKVKDDETHEEIEQRFKEIYSGRKVKNIHIHYIPKLEN